MIWMPVVWKFGGRLWVFMHSAQLNETADAVVGSHRAAATQWRPENANFAIDLVKLPDGFEPPSLTLLDQISHEHYHNS
jgi:hypothetical protein